MKSKVCIRCGIPHSFRSVKINRSGLCNLCTTMEKYHSRLFSPPEPDNRFIKSIQRRSGEAQYDCILGISGGRDSTYVLKALVEDYNLKVFTFTYDNLFLSDASRNNIADIVEYFGVDHQFFSLPEPLMKQIYQQSLKRLGSPCSACAILAYISSVYLGITKKIPLVIHGRTPAQLFKEFHRRSYDPFLPFLLENLGPYNAQANKKLMLRALKKALSLLSWGLDKELKVQLLNTVFPLKEGDPRKLKAEDCPEFLGYFLFHSYDKAAVSDFHLVNRLEHHADCIVHDAAEYLRREITGTTLAEAENSSALRIGQSFAESEVPRFDEIPEESLHSLEKATGLPAGSWKGLISSSKRLQKWMKPVLRLKYLFHPEKFDAL